MPVIGIDQSLTHTGIVVLNSFSESFKTTILHQQAIVPKMKEVERLIFIRDNITSIIKKYQTDFGAIEGYAFLARGGMVFSLGELGGVIRVALRELNVQNITVAPMTLKKFATGKGKGDKNFVMLNVFKRWNYEFEDDNVTDAFVLAKISQYVEHIKRNNIDQNTFFRTFPKLTQPQVEVIKKFI